MRRIRGTLGRWLGIPLSTVLLGLSIALPLLESGEGSTAPALEREHSESTCIKGHDHLLCVLGGTPRIPLPAQPLLQSPRAELDGLLLATRAATPHRAPVSATRTRAPPFQI